MDGGVGPPCEALQLGAQFVLHLFRLLEESGLARRPQPALVVCLLGFADVVCEALFFFKGTKRGQ